MLNRTPRRSSRTGGRLLVALLTCLALAGLAWALYRPGQAPADPKTHYPVRQRPGPEPTQDPVPPPAAPAPSEPARLDRPMRWDELQAPGFCPADGSIRLPTVESLLRVAARRPSAPRSVIEAELNVQGGHREEARKRLRDVRHGLAEHPQAALAYALLQAHQPELTSAIQAIEVYLAQRPDDVAIRQLHARLRLQADLQIEHVHLSHDGVSLLVPDDFLRGQANDLLALVLDALDEAARLTGTRRRDALTVVVYRDRSDLLATSCVRTWAAGLYDGTIRLAADAMGRPRVWRQRIRHEVLHAQLGAKVPRVPRWFNEGLAQCFADQLGPGHLRTYERMLAGQTWIPFSSLEGSFSAFQDPSDAGMAYHQSLAMVQMMVDRDGLSAIALATVMLREGRSLDDLLAAIFPEGADGRALLAFLERWRGDAWVPQVRCTGG